MTYFISYGFLGGQLTGRKMDRLLKSVGYQPAVADKADILVAHSAGCWTLPRDASPKLVVYVGMPLAEPSLRTTLRNNRAVTIGFLRPFKPLAALRYYWLVLLYVLTQTRRNYRIIRSAKDSAVVEFKSAKTVVISNSNDVWAAPSNSKKFKLAHPQWAFVSLPGSHNHIWQEPAKYVEIINEYAKRLA